MYAEVMFKEPALQKLHKILDLLESEFEISFHVQHEQGTVTAEEVVKTVADQMNGKEDLAHLAKDLEFSYEEAKPVTQ